MMLEVTYRDIFLAAIDERMFLSFQEASILMEAIHSSMIEGVYLKDEKQLRSLVRQAFPQHRPKGRRKVKP